MPGSPFESARIRLLLQRDLLKVSCLKFRHVDGYIGSMHQSGNHWIRHVFSAAMARHFDRPEMSHLGDVSLVNGLKIPFAYEDLPRIVCSHRICSPLVHSAAFQKVLKYPPYVILIRDLREMLVSHYERFKTRYQISFAEYLRGDISGRKFNCDLWDSIRFLNAWGRIRRQMPDNTIVVRYEDMKRDVSREAQRIWEFFRLPKAEKSLFVEAAKASTKEELAKKEKAAGKTGQIVRTSTADVRNWYSESDKAFLMETCNRYLRHDFGYDYSRFDADRTAAAA